MLLQFYIRALHHQTNYRYRAGLLREFLISQMRRYTSIEAVDALLVEYTRPYIAYWKLIEGQYEAVRAGAVRSLARIGLPAIQRITQYLECGEFTGQLSGLFTPIGGQDGLCLNRSLKGRLAEERGGLVELLTRIGGPDVIMPLAAVLTRCKHEGRPYCSYDIANMTKIVDYLSTTDDRRVLPFLAEALLDTSDSARAPELTYDLQKLFEQIINALLKIDQDCSQFLRPDILACCVSFLVIHRGLVVTRALEAYLNKHIPEWKTSPAASKAAMTLLENCLRTASCDDDTLNFLMDLSVARQQTLLSGIFRMLCCSDCTEAGMRAFLDWYEPNWRKLGKSCVPECLVDSLDIDKKLKWFKTFGLDSGRKDEIFRDTFENLTNIGKLTYEQTRDFLDWYHPDWQSVADSRTIILNRANKILEHIARNWSSGITAGHETCVRLMGDLSGEPVITALIAIARGAKAASKRTKFNNEKTAFIELRDQALSALGHVDSSGLTLESRGRVEDEVASLLNGLEEFEELDGALLFPARLGGRLSAEIILDKALHGKCRYENIAKYLDSADLDWRNSAVARRITEQPYHVIMDLDLRKQLRGGWWSLGTIAAAFNNAKALCCEISGTLSGEALAPSHRKDIERFLVDLLLDVTYWKPDFNWATDDQKGALVFICERLFALEKEGVCETVVVVDTMIKVYQNQHVFLHEGIEDVLSRVPERISDTALQVLMKKEDLVSHRWAGPDGDETYQTHEISLARMRELAMKEHARRMLKSNRGQ